MMFNAYPFTWFHFEAIATSIENGANGADLLSLAPE